MGEKMGMLIAIAIFAMGMLPLGIDYYTFNVASSQFLNASTEMQQLVTEEGGVTDRVKYVTDSSTIHYSFENESGQKVDGMQDVGDVVYIQYEYDWDGIYAKQKLETINTVRIARR